MAALFLNDNKANHDDDGNTRRIAKNNMFILTNNNFARAHVILGISLPSLHHYDMKLPNFTSPLYGVGEHNTKIVAFFF